MNHVVKEGDNIVVNVEEGASASASASTVAMTKPDRSPACRAIIVHPHFQNKQNQDDSESRSSSRHPIYSLLSKQHQTWRKIPIPGFPTPFVVHQNFQASQEDLGSVVWSGGIAAAAYLRQYYTTRRLLNQTKPWGEERCLELGCGTAALVSQSAALCGIRTVMTDLPQVLEWATQNVQYNLESQWKDNPQLEASLGKSEPGSISPLLSAKTLCWGEPDELLSQAFDVVVAADCLYVTRENPDLEEKLLYTLTRLVANSKTKLLIAYQNRTGHERKFVHETLPEALSHSYRVQEVDFASENESVLHPMAWVLPKGGVVE